MHATDRRRSLRVLLALADRLEQQADVIRNTSGARANMLDDEAYEVRRVLRENTELRCDPQPKLPSELETLRRLGDLVSGETV